MCESITTLLYSPSNGSFFLFLFLFYFILFYFINFMGPFQDHLWAMWVLPAPRTFVPTPWTIVCAPCHESLLLTPEALVHAHNLHLLFILQEVLSSPCHEPLLFTPRTLIHARTLHFFIRTPVTFVCECATPPYCTPSSALIPHCGVFLVSP